MELTIVVNSLLAVGENQEVQVLRNGVEIEAELSCTETGKFKKNVFIPKSSGVCVITAKYGDSVYSTTVTIMEKVNSKRSRIKEAIVDTSMFAVLNPDVFILCLIILGCIAFASVITLIFVKEVTFVKVLTGILTMIVTFFLTVAKSIVPKGKISKELETKYFPQGDKILRNTSEFLRKKK